MRTSNAMQLKAVVRNKARELGVSAQLVMQNYMLERLLERIALSPYRDNLVLKGGFYLASVMGLGTRATMDMDATLQGYPLDGAAVAALFGEVCAIDAGDGVSFSVERTDATRGDDPYGGLRVHLVAAYPPMAVPLKVDVTTADAITPCAVEYGYPLMFDGRSVSVLAYNLETALAEKLEAVLSRGDQTTRMRDYYDVYMLSKLKGDAIDMPTLGDALAATSAKRGTLELMGRCAETLAAVRGSAEVRRLWDAYRNEFPYASGVELDDAVSAVADVMSDAWEPRSKGPADQVTDQVTD